MSTYTYRVYENCRMGTFLYNLVKFICFMSGLFGFLSVYYVFFPTKETNLQFVTISAIVGIPLFFICLFLLKKIDKWARKKMAEKKISTVSETPEDPRLLPPSSYQTTRGDDDIETIR